MNRSSLPRKTRNQQIYYAAMQTASKQLSCALSKDLRKKYGLSANKLLKDFTIDCYTEQISQTYIEL